MRTKDGYRATRNEKGYLIVHDVPIFPTHYRSQKDKRKRNGDPVKFSGHYTKKWLEEAAQWAKEQQRDGYAPPLNIYHHSPDPQENAKVQSIGVFRTKGVKTITYKGERKPSLVADLEVRRTEYQDDVIRGIYPYFSVEIFNVDQPPQINALSLLDDMEPFFQLPMLEVAEVVEPDAPNGTTPAPWEMNSAEPGDALVACYSAGTRQASLFHRLAMAEEQTTEEFGEGIEPKVHLVTETDTGTVDPSKWRIYEQGGQDAPPAEKPAPDGPPPQSEGEGESEEDKSTADDFDIEPILKAVQDKTISVGAQEALIGALKASLAAAAGGEQQPQQQPQQQQPAPASLPGGGETMSAEETPEMGESYAAIAAEATVLKSRIAALESKQKRDGDVDAAMAKLSPLNLGGNVREDLEKYHTDHDGAGFDDHVAAIEKYAASFTPDNVQPMTDVAPDVSDTVVAYQEHGPEALKHAAFYAECHSAGNNAGGMTEAEYVAINMQSNHGITLKTA